MKVVYEAENILDANLAKGLLAQAHIPAIIKGEYLQGGLGDLPACGLVMVLVEDEDEAMAEGILQSWQNGDFAIEDSEDIDGLLPD